MAEERSHMVTGRSGSLLHGLKIVVLFILALLFLLPFYVIFRNAFSSSEAFVAADWKWLPDNLDFSVLRDLFSDTDLNLPGAMVHSAIQAVGQTVLTVMVPTAVTFVPSFIMTTRFGWIDSYRGLIIPMMFSAFATYMFRQSLLEFPKELEEASNLDGANPWTTMWRIVVPNSKGIIAAVSTITFIGAWNSFLWPLLVARDNTTTVQLTLSRFMTSQGVNYSELFAGALVAIVPVVIVFLVLQRYLVQGLETSGMD